MMAVTHAVLPHLRKQRAGRIFNISSVAGLKGVFGASLYNASKFAVEGFSQALARGMRFVRCEGYLHFPGLLPNGLPRREFRQICREGIAEYAKPLADFLAFHEERNHTQAGDPAKLASVLLHLSKVENPPVSFVAGSDGVEWVEGAIREKQQQVEEWRELSASTDGDWTEEKK